MLNLDNNVKASGVIQCPWEIAISELRICFTLLSLLSCGIGLLAVKNKNKKYAGIV